MRDAEDTQPLLAAEGGAFVAAMYAEEERAQKLGLVGEALVEQVVAVDPPVEVVRYLVDRLSVVPGVATVRLSGARRYAMRVWLDRKALAARQLTVQVGPISARTTLEKWPECSTSRPIPPST